MNKLDRAWLANNPLPPLSEGGDKNARGRVLVVGGAEFVPGALRLTGEAALRTGAGKLQLATVRAAAMSLAVLVPEAAMIALPADENGEISWEAVESLEERLPGCDTLVLGPGMSASERTERFVAALLEKSSAEQTVVLDAAALTCARNLGSQISARGGRAILTPHHGEMAHLTGLSSEVIDADPAGAAERVAQDFSAVVVLKGVRTIIASPNKSPLIFEGGISGLATGGSGDVLAGIIGGIAARGAPTLTAAGWGVFVHGSAGERAADQIAELGFMARDLLPFIPGLIAELSR